MKQLSYFEIEIQDELCTYTEKLDFQKSMKMREKRGGKRMKNQ